VTITLSDLVKIDATGITIASLQEIYDFLVAEFKTIYGSDLIIDSNSAAGQRINILAQTIRTFNEALLSIYNGHDPDLAIGKQLENIASLNGIIRQGGTFTQQQITITVDRDLTLQGLDNNANDVNGTGFTVADNLGQKYILLDTVNLTPGIHVKTFRAKDMGVITSQVNTITVPITIILGVVGINNTSGAVSIGKSEETDAEFRLRRQLSIANAASGDVDSIQSAILNVTGVTEAAVFNNNTSSTNTKGIPGHSVWVIVEGGANTDIANAINAKLNPACGMKGSIAVNIKKQSGDVEQILFDRSQSKNLYTRFNIKKISAEYTFDESSIKTYISTNTKFTIGQSAETSIITTVASQAINSKGGGGVPVNVEISKDNTTWLEYLDVDLANEKWILDIDRILITII